MKNNSKKNVVSAAILDELEINPVIEAELARFSEVYTESAPNLLRKVDYARWSFILEKISGSKTLLDVGVGAGQFVNAAAGLGIFTDVQGLDIIRHSKYLENKNNEVHITYASAINMPFDTDAFDIVTCLEVIEHLEIEDMKATISELQRVARESVIITVPYCEKEPLPVYHKQRFTFSRLMELFPNATVTLCSSGAFIPWVCIEIRL